MADSVECNEASNLNKQQFRLNKINDIKDYFIAEIKERKLMSKGLCKYIASFDYFDKFLIVLSATSGSISIATSCSVSIARVIGTPVGIASASPSLAFSVSTGIVKKLSKTTRNKEKSTIKSLSSLEAN